MTLKDVNSFLKVGISVIFFFYYYLFLDRREGREKEREKHQCVVASHTPPTGDLAHNPGVCPDWELNQRSFGSQASAQSTEPHQPGPTSEISIKAIGFLSIYRSL